MPFRDRTEAGKLLAEALSSYRDQKPIILALPRGGVPIGAEIAAALDAPLDLLLVRKIGAPMQPELAMGAVVDGAEPIVVRNDDVISLLRIDAASFDAVCQSELAEIERRRQRYLAGRPPLEVKDRVAIVVDDGIATGATIRAGLQATRKRQAEEAGAGGAGGAAGDAGRASARGGRGRLPGEPALLRRHRRLLCGFQPGERRGGDRAPRRGRCALRALERLRGRPAPTGGRARSPRRSSRPATGLPQENRGAAAYRGGSRRCSRCAGSRRPRARHPSRRPNNRRDRARRG